MESIKTRGIVARRADYSESNCMLTVISEDLGVISVCVYGVKSKKSKMRAPSQFLTYADFILSKKNSDIYRADSIEIIDAFSPISTDIEGLALTNYLCELTCDSYTDNDTRIMRLLLNTLYAMAYKGLDIYIAKAVFELKLMQYCGYEPNVDSCSGCGAENGLCFFDYSSGALCSSCVKLGSEKVQESTLSAMRYIIRAEENRLFSFRISETIKKDLSKIAERYVARKNERNYKSLNYLKKLI